MIEESISSFCIQILL